MTSPARVQCSCGRPDGRGGQERPAGRLQRSPGTHGAGGHDQIGCGERELGIRRSPRNCATASRCSTPITGKMEFNGTSILEISDPANPRLVWHIPNETNRNSRSVSVVYDYKFDSVRPRLPDSQLRGAHAGRNRHGSQVPDLRHHVEGHRPLKISLVSEITGTPPNSCGPGCGGKFMLRAHKGWWSEETGYFYAASGEPGFRNVIIQIFDLKNPKQPKLVGRAWLPGTQGRRARLRRPVLPSSDCGRREQAALRRIPQCRRPGGIVRYFRSGVAETGLVDRHESATSRAAHGVADCLRHRCRILARARCLARMPSLSMRPAAPGI